jgi:sporulation protein YlmC with PRC-barrel domain
MTQHRIQNARRRLPTLVSAAVLAAALGTSAFGQQMASPNAGPAEVFVPKPMGTTVTNIYKRDVYDPGDHKIGAVDDVLLDKAGRVTALVVGVGGFLGMGEKDVAVAYNSVRATRKNNEWYLVMNTTKDALKAAPGVSYDKSTASWGPSDK